MIQAAGFAGIARRAPRRRPRGPPPGLPRSRTRRTHRSRMHARAPSWARCSLPASARHRRGRGGGRLPRPGHRRRGWRADRRGRRSRSAGRMGPGSSCLGFPVDVMRPMPCGDGSASAVARPRSGRAVRTSSRSGRSAAPPGQRSPGECSARFPDAFAAPGTTSGRRRASKGDRSLFRPRKDSRSGFEASPVAARSTGLSIVSAPSRSRACATLGGERVDPLGSGRAGHRGSCPALVRCLSGGRRASAGRSSSPGLMVSHGVV